MKLAIGSVTIDGGFDELAAVAARIIEGLEHQSVSVAQIYAAADELEQAYARAGFVLVRVTVPPQRLVENGPVKLLVIDGYIESIRSEGLPQRIRNVVVARIAALIGRRHLRLAEIERALLIAGDAPGLRLKSALAAGEKPGGTVLVVEGEHHLVTGTTGLNNRLPVSLGTWQSTTSLALNSALGLGEQVYGSFGSGLFTGGNGALASPLRVAGAGLVLPLGVDGWSLNPEYTNSQTMPAPVSGAPVSVGEFERWTVRSNFSPIRSRSQTLSLTGAIEYITQTLAVPAFSTDLNHDRYAAVRAGLAWQMITFGGTPVQINAQLSQGIGGRGGLDAAASGIPLSRQGASPEFTKLNLEASLKQPLPLGARLDVIGQTQTSFGRPLFLSEQIALDGSDAISAYASGTFSVDSGATLRAELTRPLLVDAVFSPFALSPYVFGAAGWGHLAMPTAVEQADVNADAAGVGVRYGLDMPNGFNGATFAAEIAQQFSSIPTQRHGYRGAMALALRF